jgi:hypothetical protein
MLGGSFNGLIDCTIARGYFLFSRWYGVDPYVEPKVHSISASEASDALSGGHDNFKLQSRTALRDAENKQNELRQID